ncbi:MAG: ribonuclease J [Candidatus Nealsonbacteria bacterium]|nr:ribonuclease J [Candidatus Nealsonbacteria bacterium]
MNEKTRKELRVIPLGGLGEVGKNMTLFEWDKKILIVDVGLKMPNETMLGIDYLIPNIACLKGREKDILGIIFTHGHYDHIGAVPYLIEKMGNPPIFASALTRGIIIKRQDGFPFQPKLDITEISEDSKIELGPFKLEFFHQNHNIADNLGIFIQTPVGNIMHTSDFKFDATPTNDKPTNLNRIKELASRGVLLLMMDSTGAENEGHSLSEKVILENLDEIFKGAKGRIITATFSSLISRIQNIIHLSEKYGRKVAIEGSGMKTNIEICRKLKHISTKKGTIVKTKNILDYPDNRITVLGTGAQGEGRAALMRIATKEHPHLKFQKGDTIIFSSSVIPGNERTVQELKDDILRQGAEVFHYKMMDIHAGGHANQDELEEMLKITKPKFLMPIHGQFSMFVALKKLAMEKLSMPEKDIILADNGNIINVTPTRAFIDKVTVPSNYIMVDGLGVGDIGEVVLRDRKALAEDGMFVIIAVVDKQLGKIKGSPDIISRGFVYLKESKDLLYQTRKKTIQIINKFAGTGGSVNWSYAKDELRNQIGQFLYDKTERRPIILPVIIEV